MEWKKAAALDQQKSFAFQSLMANSFGFPYGSGLQERDGASTTLATAEDLLFFNAETQPDVARLVDQTASYTHAFDAQQLLHLQENASGTPSGLSISELLNKANQEVNDFALPMGCASSQHITTDLTGFSSSATEQFTPPANQAPSQSTSSIHKDCRKLCSVEGCTSQARAFQRCKKHGGSKRCTFPNCTKSIQSRGLCIRHGGGSRCQETGCLRAAQSAGRCKNHGGGRLCIVQGCDKKAHLRRLCRRHGGGAKCNVADCQKWAQRQGMCMTHAKQAIQSVPAPPPVEQVV